jgi:hypothetical protein
LQQLIVRAPAALQLTLNATKKVLALLPQNQERFTLKKMALSQDHVEKIQ